MEIWAWMGCGGRRSCGCRVVVGWEGAWLRSKLVLGLVLGKLALHSGLLDPSTALDIDKFCRCPRNKSVAVQDDNPPSVLQP